MQWFQENGEFNIVISITNVTLALLLKTGQVLFIYFLCAEKLEGYEVEEFLNDVLYNEFDTVVDDGSVRKVEIVNQLNVYTFMKDFGVYVSNYYGSSLFIMLDMCQVSDQICQFYGLCLLGQLSELQALLESLPSCSGALQHSIPAGGADEDMSDSDSDDVCEQSQF